MPADTTLIDALTGYLQGRQAMPKIKRDYLGDDVNGRFDPFVSLPGGQITLAPGAGPGSLAHELTHAADFQFIKQYRDPDKPAGKTQFDDAYEKMGAGRNNLVSLQKIGPAAWWQSAQDYRGAPTEATAFGVGNHVQPTAAHSRAPPHVDATAATELAILLELANRQQQRK